MPIRHATDPLDSSKPFLLLAPRPGARSDDDGPLALFDDPRSRISDGAFALPAATGGVRIAPLPAPSRSLEAYRDWGRSAGAYARAAFEHSGSELRLDLTEENLAEAHLRQILAGLLSGLGAGLDTVDLAVRTGFPASVFDRILADERNIHSAVALAIELVDARSNQLTPEQFVERARAVASEAGLGCRVTSADELKADGFGGITAIGQGSARRPYLLELWYSGTGAPGAAPPEQAVALAGKGVTFDSGGLSLKSPEAMYSMHIDCAGAATALAVLSILPSLEVDVPVYVALPLVENVPGPESIRPGDVVKMRNGAGLEIVDTDFEGRVILADAVALLAESRPRAVLSLATLTYQVEIALGPEIAGLFGRDDALAERILNAAELGAEALWRMPWAERYSDQLLSRAPDAQIRNHPLTATGRAITAALFIGAFVPEGIPFAHVDFTGPTYASTPNGPAATGYGVRTLVELLRGWR